MIIVGLISNGGSMSFSEKTDRVVEELIESEHLNSMKNHGEVYSSLHEGYAVLLEEIEEVLDDIRNLISLRRIIWRHIKQDNTEHDTCFEQCLFLSEMHTEHAIKELAQVGAVLRKIEKTLNLNKGD